MTDQPETRDRSDGDGADPGAAVPETPARGASPAPEDGDENDAAPIRALLRQVDVEQPIHAPSILPAVQRKIRERSRGRFYRDGWSTQQTRTSTYVVTALLALLVVGLVYFVLVPGILGPVR